MYYFFYFSSNEKETQKSILVEAAQPTGLGGESQTRRGSTWCSAAGAGGHALLTLGLWSETTGRGTHLTGHHHNTAGLCLHIHPHKEQESELSGISAKGTKHKCLQELTSFNRWLATFSTFY